MLLSSETLSVLIASPFPTFPFSSFLDLWCCQKHLCLLPSKPTPLLSPFLSKTAPLSAYLSAPIISKLQSCSDFHFICLTAPLNVVHCPQFEVIWLLLHLLLSSLLQHLFLSTHQSFSSYLLTSCFLLHLLCTLMATQTATYPVSFPHTSHLSIHHLFITLFFAHTSLPHSQLLYYFYPQGLP